jgi:glucose/arabinose dehydrogenase
VLSIVPTAFALSHVAAQRGDVTCQAPPDGAATTDETLRQNFVAEHESGRRFRIDPSDLPAPKAGLVVTDRPLTKPYDGQVPPVPSGFTATSFATDLANPRRLFVLPNGDVLVAEQVPVT